MLTYSPSLRTLAVCLAMLAGFVDAIAFLQLGGFFVSFMSGNSTRLGVGLALAPQAAAIAGLLIGAFVIGVAAGSLLSRRAGRHRRQVILFGVAAALGSAAVAHAGGLSLPAAALMALAMGATNAVFERDGESRFGVTYMTGALVKLGQGLAAAASGGPRWTWLAYLFLWLGLTVGAGTGALTYGYFGGKALWAASAVAGLLALVAGMTKEPHNDAPPSPR